MAADAEPRWHAHADAVGRDRAALRVYPGRALAAAGRRPRAKAVAEQENDPDSLLSLTRNLIAFRNANEALLAGSLIIVEAHEDFLVFERHSSGQLLLCAFNMGSENIVVERRPSLIVGGIVTALISKVLETGTYGGWIAERIA